ncbi:MAG: SAM hydroxide adenosyltransferase [Balneolaceae bacterium]
MKTSRDCNLTLSIKQIVCSLFVLILFLYFSGTSSAQSASYALHEGGLNGAPYKVAVPEGWSGGKVFFHVHGWRPADAPHQADLDLEDPFYKELLDMDWVIARTAFYENGVNNEAHIRALRILSSWIDTNIGTVRQVVMEGESTAGSLLLRIAELEPNLADGVIAKGAFIDLDDESSDSFLRGTPQIPAILMSNFTELDGPIAYAAISEDAEVPPALRPLRRPGHVNVNWLERLDAFNSLIEWIETGEMAPITDGTRTVPERETGTSYENEMLVNKVSGIDPYFGNAKLGFHPDELEQFGIIQGETFIIEIDGQQRNVFYGETYGDVTEGEWVAFPTADDHIMLVRNHESAVKTAGLHLDDQIKIAPLP